MRGLARVCYLMHKHPHKWRLTQEMTMENRAEDFCLPASDAEKRMSRYYVSLIVRPSQDPAKLRYQV